MSEKYPTVDATKKVVRDANGKRITPEDIETIIADGQALKVKVPGRPSLTAAGEQSPRINVRLQSQVHAELLRRARKDKTTVSALTREMLTALVRMPEADVRKLLEMAGVKAKKTAV